MDIPFCRIEHPHDLADLNEAILLNEEVVHLAPSDHLLKPTWLFALSKSLMVRFLCLGDPDDMNRAISVAKEALLTPDHDDDSTLLNYLGILFFHRSRRTSDLADITDSVTMFQKAVHSTPDDHPDKASRLRNLGISSCLRFQVSGDLADIDKCHSALEEEVHIRDAAGPASEISDTPERVWFEQLLMNLDPEFTEKCVSQLMRIVISYGDKALGVDKSNEAFRTYSRALSLSPLDPVVVNEWAGMMMRRGTVYEVLNVTIKTPRLIVYRTICNVLEAVGRVAEAMMCSRLMRLLEDGPYTDEHAQWGLDFRNRCLSKLEAIGDSAMDSKNHMKAIEYYADVLSVGLENAAEWELDFRRPIKQTEKLDGAVVESKYHDNSVTCSPSLTNINNIIIKCCSARVGLLKEALVQADKEILRDESSYRGYMRKYVVLHGLSRHKEAFRAFKIMLSKINNSPDPQIRELHGHYIDITSQIRGLIEKATRGIPLVFIDVTTGQLADKSFQAKAFEELPIYDQLRSSMTTPGRLDQIRIWKEVKEFYRYVTFSHRWQLGEPTFQLLQGIAACEKNLKGSVYGLPESPANYKLRNFCELVRSRGFRWAWSDTCCINHPDKRTQQESIVSMFRWYRGSSLTIVHLLGVLSTSQVFGCLWRSIWNTRGWTLHEYIASEVVQFYTEDWKPYLGLDMFNHKESPAILSEMENAMNLSTQQLITLQPGLDRAREKLYLASRRYTTREEDIAYSLFGIFGVALPVIYGEGHQAVGRLLEHILTRSDDVTLLAWTGIPGSNHSYLPVDLTVYDQIMPPHVPKSIEAAEMDTMVTRSMLTSDPSQTVALYERLYDLPPLSLIAGRLRLPGIIFPLHGLSRPPKSDSHLQRVYRATTPMLGDVDIMTADSLDRTEGLVLIHPWIAPLLDEDFSSDTPQFDLATRAVRLVVRLKQPFGALLLAPLARARFRRVATDSLIMVQVREETPLTDLMDGIRTVDIQ